MGLMATVPSCADNVVPRFDLTSGQVQCSDIVIEDPASSATVIKSAAGNHLTLESGVAADVRVDMKAPGRSFQVRDSTGALAGGFIGGGNWWQLRNVLPTAAGQVNGAPTLPWGRGFINSLYVDTVAKSANYAVTDFDEVHTVIASGAGTTITLPTVGANEGRLLVIKRNDAANVQTVDGEGSETIDGALTLTLDHDDSYVKLQSDAGEWHVIARDGILAPVGCADNTIPRFNLTAGQQQCTDATIDDSGDTVLPGNLTVGGPGGTNTVFEWDASNGDSYDYNFGLRRILFNGSSLRSHDLNDGFFREEVFTVNNRLEPDTHLGAQLGIFNRAFIDAYVRDYHSSAGTDLTVRAGNGSADAGEKITIEDSAGNDVAEITTAATPLWKFFNGAQFAPQTSAPFAGVTTPTGYQVFTDPSSPPTDLTTSRPWFWSGSEWNLALESIDELEDVDVTGVTSNDVLAWDGVDTWVTGPPLPTNFYRTATDNFSTISATFVTITGSPDNLTVTPGAGTYWAMFSGRVNAVSGNSVAEISIHSNGSEIVESRKQADLMATSNKSVTTMAKTTVTAGQAIDVRMRRASGLGTPQVAQKAFILMRIEE
jgi:hypothetical protein